MSELSSFRERLFSLPAAGFEDFALEVFHWQSANNPVYRQYIRHLGIDAKSVKRLEAIPFLPIEFFKQHIIKTGEWHTALTFFSSGTTGQDRSRHHLDDPVFYNRITQTIFEELYGPLSDHHFLALLPSYLEREGSSLIHMISHFIERSGSAWSGFYLKNIDELLDHLDRLRHERGTKVLWGVTFALLDLAGQHALDLSEFVVMETGGMKGRRKESIREEVHKQLKGKFNVPAIHSEYGMTELLSQAYSKGEGVFVAPLWMKTLIRDINDPFTYLEADRTGGINVIDLANLHSCCFIETRDLGRSIGKSGEFEVLGRFDNSDVRGCNLLVQ